MIPAHQPELAFDAADQAAEDGEALVVDIDGYEGPLHVLLALARQQKVDLRQLSIAKLADQYLAFVHAARKRRFSLAADYLVMAAWLTFLKSRLLLPKPERAGPGEQAAEEIAEVLAMRLAKLDQVRRAVEALQNRPQLGRDVFMRGDPDAITVHSTTRLTGSLYELIGAYVTQRKREAVRRYRPTSRVEAYPLEEARTHLRESLPELSAWTPIGDIAPCPAADLSGPTRASYVASTLSAGLEMVKEGALEASQREVFADLFLRQRAARAPTLLAAE